MFSRQFVVKGLIPYAIALVAIGSVALAQPSPQSVGSSSPAKPPSEPSPPLPKASNPRRLTISVSVATPEDLKVREGDRLTPNQLIADRSRDRDRLQAQAQQLELTLQRLENATVTPPQPPAPVPVVAALPTANYLEEEAAIERAKVTVAQAERAMQQKEQEMDYLRSLSHLDPIVLEHEQAKLTDLQQDHTAAVRDYQLAIGRLGSAQDETAYREYRHALTLAEHTSQANQTAMGYQRQWAAYEQQLRDRDVQLAQTQLKLDEVNNAIASLAVVRSPYAGRIRRIKWLGQGADGLLRAEVTLLVRASGPSADAPLPGQLDAVPRDADGAGDSEFFGD